ncbi:hypothetical protein ABID26_005530 [Mesorhizobium shonense]|uniref:Uncharacterized protein n=1 Tax=Mesorhizobium shonense TaxID=1209948 RepID=A0ABV2HZW1_9HYPH
MLSIEAGVSRSCLLPTESFEKLPLGAKRRPLDRDVARQNDSGGRLRGAPGHQAADLAFVLSDRPIGLAAWIAEKFRAWSDCGGELERAMPIETLLTDISIYWFSGNIAASLRLYKEMRLQPLTFDAGERVSVPFGVSVFPRELPMPPRSWVERALNVVRWTYEDGASFGIATVLGTTLAPPYGCVSIKCGRRVSLLSILVLLPDASQIPLSHHSLAMQGCLLNVKPADQDFLFCGFPFRFVEAILSSSFSLIDFSMLLEAPLSSLFFFSPRFAARAAPAAICWALDLAGICLLLFQSVSPLSL